MFYLLVINPVSTLQELGCDFEDIYGVSNSLVTAVPLPLMPGSHREEVCCSLVLHSLWEAQQNSIVEVTHTRVICRAEGKGNRK